MAIKHKKNPHKQGFDNFRVGKFSERLATFFLALKGYKILHTRYQTLSGEIDILAAKNDTLIAVEVKRRTSLDGALNSILPHQKARIRRALMQAHKHYPTFTDLRIDTILISPLKWPIHIKNAF